MSEQERRKFSRVAFDAQTLLSQGGQQWKVQLIDLSLKGALIKTPKDWQPSDRPCALTVTLDRGTTITMTLLWRHSHDDESGFECQYVDIDSITHLRRLVELNTGDSQLLERELASLGQPQA